MDVVRHDYSNAAQTYGNVSINSGRELGNCPKLPDRDGEGAAYVVKVGFFCPLYQL